VTGVGQTAAEKATTTSARGIKAAGGGMKISTMKRKSKMTSKIMKIISIFVKLEKENIEI